MDPMTAPDPTAGEVWTDADIVYTHPDSTAGVTASTSEDVEALAKVLTDAGLGTANNMACAVLASDWLADREAVARAEGAAAVRDDIRARRREFRRLNADQRYLDALDDAYGLAANRAQEDR